MKIEPFHLERYFAEHEFTAPYLLCCSDCEAMTVADLLKTEEGAEDSLNKIWLGYTESRGHPELRREIAALYTHISAEQILVHAGAQEAIHNFVQIAFKPGDHLIVHYPCYQSLFSVAEAVGCEVTQWTTRPENNWDLDIDFLKKNIRPNTRAIIVNCPHNPTGYLMSREKQNEIVAVARKHNLIVFSDEVYRLLEYREEDRLPAAADLYERAVSLNVMSKSYGLAGLRIGWIATRDPQLYNDFAAMKDYTSICNSAPAEMLAMVALRQRDKIIRRNLGLIRGNLDAAAHFFKKHAGRFDWQAPKAGPIAFPALRDNADADDFCSKLLKATGVLLLPGSRYDKLFRRHFRFGFGRANFVECLGHFEKFLN
jgi:aspartate/methionine/tyrosine aminotransferase